MTHEVTTNDDGTTTRVTVGEAIVRNLAAGGYVEQAAAACGIDKPTLYAWLKRGARARRKSLNGKGAVPATDRQYVEFSNAVATGQVKPLTRAEATIAQLMAGGRTVRHETVKTNAAGEVLERTVRTETLAPDAASIRWWLERRWSKLYGHLGSLEITGADGAPLIPEADRARDLAEALADFQAGREAQAAEDARKQAQETQGAP